MASKLDTSYNHESQDQSQIFFPQSLTQHLKKQRQTISSQEDPQAETDFELKLIDLSPIKIQSPHRCDSDNIRLVSCLDQKSEICSRQQRKILSSVESDYKYYDGNCQDQIVNFQDEKSNIFLSGRCSQKRNSQHHQIEASKEGQRRKYSIENTQGINKRIRSLFSTEPRDQTPKLDKQTLFHRENKIRNLRLNLKNTKSSIQTPKVEQPEKKKNQRQTQKNLVQSPLNLRWMTENSEIKKLKQQKLPNDSKQTKLKNIAVKLNILDQNGNPKSIRFKCANIRSGSINIQIT